MTETPRRSTPRVAAWTAAVALTACAGEDPEPIDPQAGVEHAAPQAPLQDVAATAVGKTEALAVLAGEYGPTLRGLYGTDLGWSFKHGDKLWMLFGDSWKAKTDFSIGSLPTGSDDALGFISLASFEDGDQIEAHVRAHPSFASKGWQAEPTILQVAPRTGTNPVAEPIQLWRNGQDLRPSGPGLTPLTGFSNARQDDTAGAFGIFFRNAQLKCRNKACVDGFACDEGLGLCVERNAFGPSPVAMACVKAEIDATRPQDRRKDCYSCAAVGGICQDRGSSMYDMTSRGRVSAVVVTQEVGVAVGSNNLDAAPDVHFHTRAWNTHRFFNAIARTVNDVDLDRADGRGNDYSTADGVDPEREGVFVWGRPHFGGLSDKVNRDAQLYLAWVPMPSYAENGQLEWAPQYFKELDAQGRPVFVEHEVDSKALDLSGPASEPSKEVLDVVGQMSISWIPSLRRWVMIYGGHLSPPFGELIFGSDWAKVTNAGPIYVRSAEQPWGPWTAPKPLLVAGNSEQLTELYRPGQILYSPKCPTTNPRCVKTEAAWKHPGVLYGPNIIEPWTEVRPNGIDLYWNLSTWNPYEVVLMKSSLGTNDLL